MVSVPQIATLEAQATGEVITVSQYQWTEIAESCTHPDNKTSFPKIAPTGSDPHLDWDTGQSTQPSRKWFPAWRSLAGQNHQAFTFKLFIVLCDQEPTLLFDQSRNQNLNYQPQNWMNQDAHSSFSLIAGNLGLSRTVATPNKLLV